MPLKKEVKNQIIDELQSEFEKSSGVVLSDYQGLDVQTLSQLRNKLREQNIRFKIYKNTLIEKAASKAGLAELSQGLSGCTAVAFSYEESISAVKILNSFSKENKDFFKLKRALVEGKVFINEQLELIAALPSKEELLAKLLGNMKSPITSFVYVIKSPISGLINVIDQIRKQKEESE